MPSTEVIRHTGVDEADVPSAKWGWSGDFPRTYNILLLLGAAFLLSMIHGNHTGRVEDWFVGGFAAWLVLLAVRDWWLRRRGWLR